MHKKTRWVKLLDHFKDSFNYSHGKFWILRCTHQRVLSHKHNTGFSSATAYGNTS